MNPLRRILLSSIALVAALPAFGQVVYCTQAKPTSVSGCVPFLSVNNSSLASGAWIVTGVPLGPGADATVGIMIYTDGVGIGPSTFSTDIPFGRLCLQGFKRASPVCPASVSTGLPETCFDQLHVTVDCNGYAGVKGPWRS